MTDGFKGTADPFPCVDINHDPEIINSTTIGNVYQAVCDDPSWEFSYISIESPLPDQSPRGGKLTIQQTLPVRIADGKLDESIVFGANLVFKEQDFERTVRSKHESAIVTLISPLEAVLAATQLLNETTHRWNWYGMVGIWSIDV